MTMNSFRGLAVAAGLLAACSTMQAVELDYNFTAQLINNSTGALFFVDGSFNADPSLATTKNGADAAGETYSVAPTGVAASLTDVYGTVLSPLDTISYNSSNVQNDTGLIYFKSFDPGDGSADPIWALSESIGSNEYLTLLLNGKAAELFESSTLGSTAGNPIASAGAVTAFATDLPQSPEPATFGLIAVAALGGLGLRKLKVKRS